MKKKLVALVAVAAGMLGGAAAPAQAQTVTVEACVEAGGSGCPRYNCYISYYGPITQDGTYIYDQSACVDSPLFPDLPDIPPITTP